MHWLLTSSEEKQRWLVDMARDDAFFASVLEGIAPLRLDLRFPFWGGAGAYKPQMVRADNDAALETLKGAPENFSIRIELCQRFGRDINAHTFLHELVHVYQDRRGMFPVPLQREEGVPVLPDMRSFIQIYVLCEALAAAHAIAASYRLKEAGDISAWHGALKSFDWGGLARSYDGGNITTLTTRWYEGNHRRYYERRALALYQAITSEYSGRIAPDHLRCIPLEEYAKVHDIKGLTGGISYDAITDHRVQKSLASFEGEFGVCQNNSFCDIEIGSLPYVIK